MTLVVSLLLFIMYIRNRCSRVILRTWSLRKILLQRLRVPDGPEFPIVDL